MAVPQEQQGKLDALLRLLDALEEQQGFSRVSSIDLSRAAWMELRYDGRFTVRMPMTGDTAKYLNTSIRWWKIRTKPRGRPSPAPST